MFFILGCVYIAIGMFLSALTESQIIAAVSTFAVLLILHLWGGLLDFIPSTAISGVIGIIAIITIVALIIYQVDKKLGYQRGDRSNWSDCMCRYIRCESSLFENLLVNLLGKLDISG